jgi:predicted Zn-dependent protease
MPGGKIAVYTGILKITQNDDALAAVMGHEIAHAVAKHSIERASQALTVNLGTQIADIFLGGAINRTRNSVGQASGMDIFQLGIFNPFGRKQETEADYLGLIFASLAGYDIRESVKLWERMSESNKGKEPPQFLSTHPSSQNRIKNLNNWITEVIVKYPPIKRA